MFYRHFSCGWQSIGSRCRPCCSLVCAAPCCVGRRFRLCGAALPTLLAPTSLDLQCVCATLRVPPATCIWAACALRCSIICSPRAPAGSSSCASKTLIRYERLHSYLLLLQCSLRGYCMQTRQVEGSLEALVDSLKWCGVEEDEGERGRR